MKKLIPFIVSILGCLSLFAQSIVPTIPLNKNVILEEFTGTNCVNCPDGHKTAANILANNPGRAFAINIHQGTFSGNNPDFKTEWGDALAQQYYINSYPNATISRGSSSYSERAAWVIESNEIISQSSPVNVAATATIDWNTRQLTVLVEVYYTANAAQGTNNLNVALLQDNVLGPQTGTAYYPEMVHFGTLYQHNHMFRHFLIGQWGDEINTTTAGTFFSKTYNYTIPAHIRNVPLYLKDLSVLAYVCENQKTVLSGNQAVINYLNLPTMTARIEQLQNSVVDISCDGNASIIAIVRNENATPIQSLELSYTVSSAAAQTYHFDNREIAPCSFDSIHLPLIINPNQNTNIKVNISKINGISIYDDFDKSITIIKNVGVGTPAKFIIGTDRYASETTFKIFHPDGSVVLEGGPWNNATMNGVIVREFDFVTPVIGCYKVIVYDSSGDGINSGYGAGYFRVVNASGTTLINHNGIFNFEAGIPVEVDNLKITDNQNIEIKVSPNPCFDFLIIDGDYNYLEITSITGQLVSKSFGLKSINISNITNGLYFVKVFSNNKIRTFKIVKK